MLNADRALYKIHIAVDCMYHFAGRVRRPEDRRWRRGFRRRRSRRSGWSADRWCRSTARSTTGAARGHPGRKAAGGHAGPFHSDARGRTRGGAHDGGHRLLPAARRGLPGGQGRLRHLRQPLDARSPAPGARRTGRRFGGKEGAPGPSPIAGCSSHLRRTCDGKTALPGKSPTVSEISNPDYS
jgi:hypothetical protein